MKDFGATFKGFYSFEGTFPIELMSSCTDDDDVDDNVCLVHLLFIAEGKCRHFNGMNTIFHLKSLTIFIGRRKLGKLRRKKVLSPIVFFSSFC